MLTKGFSLLGARVTGLGGGVGGSGDEEAEDIPFMRFEFLVPASVKDKKREATPATYSHDKQLPV